MVDSVPAASSPEAEGPAKGNKMDSPQESARKIADTLKSFHFHKNRDADRHPPGSTFFQSPISLDYQRDAGSIRNGLQSLQQDLAKANEGGANIVGKLEGHVQAQVANWSRGVVDDTSWKQGIDIAKAEIAKIDTSKKSDEEKVALEKATSDLQALETKFYQESLVSSARTMSNMVNMRRQQADREFYKPLDAIKRIDGDPEFIDFRTEEEKKAGITMTSDILRLYERGVYSDGKHSIYADENGFKIPNNKEYRVGSRNWTEAYDVIFKMHIEKHGNETPICLNFSNDQIDDGAFGRNHYKAILSLIELAEKNGKMIDLDNSQNLRTIIHNMPGYHGLTRFSEDYMRRSDYLFMRINALKAKVLSNTASYRDKATQDVEYLKQGHDAPKTLKSKADELKAKLDDIKDPAELNKAKDELDALVKTSATMDKGAPGAKEACVALKEAVAKLRDRAHALGAEDPKNAAVCNAILADCDKMDKALDAKLVEVNSVVAKKDLNVTIEPSAPPEAAIGEGAAKDIKLSGIEAPAPDAKLEAGIGEESAIEMIPIGRPDLTNVSQSEIKRDLDAFKEKFEAKRPQAIKFDDPVDVKEALKLAVDIYRNDYDKANTADAVKDYIKENVIDKTDRAIFVDKVDGKTIDSEFKKNVEFVLGDKTLDSPSLEMKEESSISPSRPSSGGGG